MSECPSITSRARPQHAEHPVHGCDLASVAILGLEAKDLRRLLRTVTGCWPIEAFPRLALVHHVEPPGMLASWARSTPFLLADLSNRHTESMTVRGDWLVSSEVPAR